MSAAAYLMQWDVVGYRPCLLALQVQEHGGLPVR
jgi:hypothetical protein